MINFGINPLDVIAGVGLGMAFIPNIRKEIFKRDHGECQCPDCIGIEMFGESFKWDRGFNVNAAHFPEQHQRGEDSNMTHGRILCVPCHIVEEIKRGNHKGVQLLYERQTIMNTGWLKTHGWHDVKPALSLFYDLAENKPYAKDTLVDFFGMTLNRLEGV